MPRQKYHISQTLIFQQDGKQSVFIRNEELGHGSFSIVYRVTQQYTNKTYAMKVISRRQCSQKEIKIHEILNHPNIVRLERSFSDKRYHYIILEYCPGRSIREYLYRSKDNRLSEPEVKKILRDVLHGLAYIHKLGITHHDIKLENFVIGSDGNVKIGDFGLSTFQEEERGKKCLIFGTYNYLSPEAIAGRKSEDASKVDIWAVGVAAFYMLTGRQPFQGESKDVTFSNVLNLNYWFPNYLKISDDARNFIKAIFRTDPKKRPSASQLCDHPFLAECDGENVCLYKSSSLPPLNVSTNKLNKNLCQQLDDAQKVSTKQLTDSLKQDLCKKIGDDKLATPKPTTPNLNKNLCPINDNKQISTKPTTPNFNKNLCSLNGNKQVSIKQTTPNLNKNLCPINNNKQMSPKPATPNLNKNLCPINNNKQVSPKPTAANQTPSLRQPHVENRPTSARRQNDNQKPTKLPPLNNNKPVLPNQPTSNQKQSLCPPLSDIKQASPRRPNNPRPKICTPLTNNKPSTNIKPTFYALQNMKKPTSPILANVNKKSFCNQLQVIKTITSKHQDNNTKQSNDSRPVSATICILGNQIAFSPFSDNESFVIPDYFVSRYSFINNEKSYMLANGTVGVCFSDNSRIVMDPYERFVQFYEDEETEFPETVFLDEICDEYELKYVSLVKKAANHFKKIRFSYDLPEYNYDPDDIMHNIISFVKNDDSILFKLDNSNFQINFNDNTKLIIFWNDKKFCFFKYIKEKCKLMDLNNASMNLNSDELMKFKNAKILLSDFGLTIS